MGDLLLCLKLSLQLFVLTVSQFLLLHQLITLEVKLLGHLSQHLDLNVKELDLHLGFFNLLTQLSRFFQSILIVCLG